MRCRIFFFFNPYLVADMNNLSSDLFNIEFL